MVGPGLRRTGFAAHTANRSVVRLKEDVVGRIKVIRSPDRVEITYRPIGLHSFVILAVALAWDVISLNQLRESAFLADGYTSPIPWMFAAIGVGVSLFAVWGFLSRTRITLRRGRITAERSPLSSLARIELKLTSIRLLSVLRHQPNRGAGGGPASYEVFAVTHDQRSIRIARGLSLEEGNLVKKEIESYPTST